MANVIQLPPEALQGDSDWASKFVGGTTNAALRSKHDQDQSQYAQALQQQQQDHMDNLIATDKNAFAIHKGQQELDMQREKHQAEMAAAAQKLQSDAELHPLRIQEMQARTDAAISAEKSRVQSDLLKARAAKQKEDDTAGFAEHMTQAMDSGARAGSKDFQDYALKGIVSFPNADPAMQREVLAQAKINLSPEEMISQYNSLPEDQKKDAKFTFGSDGKTSIVSGSAKSLTPNAQLAGYNQQITRASSQQKELNKQIDALPDGSPEISDLRARRDALNDVIESATTAHQNILNGATQPAQDNTVMFNQPQTAQPVDQAQPAAVPDLRVLAQKALDDPAATPEHKAAAQKILGTPQAAAPVVPAADTTALAPQDQPTP